jgi:predicted nucleic acid-binding protein
MYLLDMNVVSELRRPRPNAAVLGWMANIPNEQLYICAISLGEIQAGVELTRLQNPEKATQIEAWLDVVSATHQILPLDGAVCRAWGRLMRGKSEALLEDGMIAACAIVHGLVVVTRNVRDFASLAVRTYNPFAA